jgi:ParB-like chromosome segregation protein Spo0J
MHRNARRRLYRVVEPTTAAVDKTPGPAIAQERSEVRLVRLSALSVGYSPRQMRVDEDHVGLLMEVIDRLPPVVVDERTMTVIDGVHRVEACRRVGRTHIPALFFSGDEIDALVIAIKANVRHGKPLSRSERQAAAATLLRRGSDRSDRWIGEICGLSHSTVARLRQVTEAADLGVRTGRDGRRRPVDPTMGRAAVVRALAEEPTASIRQAAGAAGVAPSTARRVAIELRDEQQPSFDRLTEGPSATTPGSIDLTPAHRDLLYSPEQPETAAWLERTAVEASDLHMYLERIPLGHIYEVVDECRRRARTWAEVADALEKQARARRGAPPGER